MRHQFTLCFLLLSLLVSATHAAPKNERERKVLGDKAKMDADDFWIYNDLKRGRETAKRAGKPLMVVFRCIP